MFLGLCLSELLSAATESASGHRAGNGVPPGVVEVGGGPARFGIAVLDVQLVAADGADAGGRDAHEMGALDDLAGFGVAAGDDDTMLGFSEQEGIRPVGLINQIRQINRRPDQ